MIIFREKSRKLYELNCSRDLKTEHLERNFSLNEIYAKDASGVEEKIFPPRGLWNTSSRIGREEGFAVRGEINKRERKNKKKKRERERTKEIGGRKSFGIGIIRLQDRQIVTTAASTLLTGRNTEWINRACYTFTRWTGLRQTNDKRWFLVTTGFGITSLRKPMHPRKTLDTRREEIYSPRPQREKCDILCCSFLYCPLFLSFFFLSLKER